MNSMRAVLPALLLCLLLVLQCPAYAQSQRPVVFKVEVPDGGYQVDLRQVTSVSVHRYLVDGAMQVDELTVDTLGNTVARFYVTGPNEGVQAPRGVGQSLIDQAENKLQDVKKRAGLLEWMDRAVIKSYPTTTHAHTVEFRFQSREQLMELYQAISESWDKTQAGTFTVE